jgi:hypothetical protein
MYLALIFEGLIALDMVYAFIIGSYHAGFTALLMFILTLVPYWVARKMDVQFPWFVFFLIAMALWFHTAGYVQGFYITYYPYYDKVAHFVTGTAVALLGFLGVIFIDRYWKMNMRPHFIAGFTVIFGLAMAAAWEIYEYTIDTIFGGNLAGRMQAGLTDTMEDMIFTLAASLLVGVLAALWFRHHRKEDVMKPAPHESGPVNG